METQKDEFIYVSGVFCGCKGRVLKWFRGVLRSKKVYSPAECQECGQHIILEKSKEVSK
jgi:hypothetical protein